MLATAVVSVFNSVAIEWMIESDLGDMTVESLEILFLPVAANLTKGRADTVDRSTVAFGVRAATSVPGILAPTLTARAMYVDGAVADNVPTSLVEAMGAGLTVTCNALPPGNGGCVVKPATSFLGRLWRQNGLLARAFELGVSFDLVLHDMGVWQDQGWSFRVRYDPPKHFFPLLQSAAFWSLPKIMKETEESPEFLESVRRA